MGSYHRNGGWRCRHPVSSPKSRFFPPNSATTLAVRWRWSAHRPFFVRARCARLRVGRVVFGPPRGRTETRAVGWRFGSARHGRSMPPPHQPGVSHCPDATPAVRCTGGQGAAPLARIIPGVAAFDPCRLGLPRAWLSPGGVSGGSSWPSWALLIAAASVVHGPPAPAADHGNAPCGPAATPPSGCDAGNDQAPRHARMGFGLRPRPSPPSRGFSAGLGWAD